MKIRRVVSVIGGILLGLIIFLLMKNIGLNVYAVDNPITAHPSDCKQDLRFAVIGDYGDAGPAEADVASLINNWDVELIVTTGDNNYPDGEASTIDANIGQYYSDYIYPYKGIYGPGGKENRFFPALGNHDWRVESLQPHYDYFNLPGNERYYEFAWEPVHFFILDSDPHEPDGRSKDSFQARWLEDQLVASNASWKVVIMHHPPFSSSMKRGGDEEMQWDYELWGADAVIAGHDHLYERLHVGGIPYFVNGLGGRWNTIDPIHRFLIPEAGSEVRYNRDYGAQLVTADDNCINFTFYNTNGDLIDSYSIVKDTN